MHSKASSGWSNFLLIDADLRIHYGRIAVIAVLAAALAVAVIWFQAATGMVPLAADALYLPLLSAALAVTGGLLGSGRYIRANR
ncbi:MAG: hypothetical protein L0H70_01915 [Xanthomonadales bacterium]|nr:hypothetical protein [Xanthomonadales bacterium]